MKCQSLFSGKMRKNRINLSSAELAQRVVKVILLLNERNLALNSDAAQNHKLQKCVQST